MFLVEATVSHKKSWDSLYFYEKVFKKMLGLFKDTQNSPSPLVHCCAKSGKVIPGSGGQEWLSKLATNIE